jgi:hypothetical protein
MKQRILLIVAMVLIAAPAFATVKIDVTQGAGADVNKLTVSYNCTGTPTPERVRAFALTLQFGSANNSMIFSANPNDINDFVRGESNSTTPGYGIFPGQFKIQIDPGNPNWRNINYTPIAPANDVDACSTGLGMRTIIAELGSLYKEDANKPASSGTLFTVRFDPNGKTSDTLTVSANTVRGGVVLEDGTTATDTNLPVVKTILGNVTPPCTVPNVVGLFESPVMTAGPNATGEILKAGLVVGARTTGPSTTVAAGKVTNQSPAGGGSVTCGSAVDINVSTGPATCATCLGDLVSPTNCKNLNDMYSIRSKLVTGYNRTGLYQVDMGSAVTGDQWNICANIQSPATMVLNLNDMYMLRTQLVAAYNSTGFYKVGCPGFTCP